MNSQIVRKCLKGMNASWLWIQYSMDDTSSSQKMSSEKDIRLDDPMQTLYPVEPNIYLPISNNTLKNLLVTFAPDEWIFNWFVRNIDEVCTVLWTLREAIESWSDVLILSNHATWFNLPLIAHVFIEYSEFHKKISILYWGLPLHIVTGVLQGYSGIRMY